MIKFKDSEIVRFSTVADDWQDLKKNYINEDVFKEHKEERKKELRRLIDEKAGVANHHESNAQGL